VKDSGQAHVMAEWGGTAFNFRHTPENFKTYIASAERFAGIVKNARADGVIANHTDFDSSKVKLPGVRSRQPGAPNPYVIGTDAVSRYLQVARECALAGLATVDDSGR
jgi:metallo-beta-lactamase class B